MRKKEAITYEETGAREECRHYWVIKMAAGPVSQGICKFCSAQKDFGNYITHCLEPEKEYYMDRHERPSQLKEEREPPEDIFSEIKRGNRNAVKAGA